MKYPYLLGERSPERTAQEFVDVLYDCETRELLHSFSEYLKRFYPVVFDRITRIWELELYVLRWPNDESSFLIGIVNARSHCIVGLFPTFKKAAKALRCISKRGLVDLPF